MGGAPELREIGEDIIVVHYDLPVPRKISENNGSVKRLISKWRSWYDSSTKALREIGYPIGYSVIVTSNENLKLVYEVASKVRDYYSKLKERDQWNLLPSIERVKIGILRFKPASKEDMQALISMFKEYLKESLLTIKEYIVKKLRDENQDPEEVNARVREMLRKLREQDKYKLLESDKELNKLLLLIEVLTI